MLLGCRNASAAAAHSQQQAQKRAGRAASSPKRSSRRPLSAPSGGAAAANCSPCLEPPLFTSHCTHLQSALGPCKRFGGRERAARNLPRSFPSFPRMLVAVIGAGGYTGRACVEQALLQGHHVRWVASPPPPPPPAAAAAAAAACLLLPHGKLAPATCRAVVRDPERCRATYASQPTLTTGSHGLRDLPTPVGERLQIVAGDVTDPASLRAALQGCDGVVYAATSSGWAQLSAFWRTMRTTRPQAVDHQASRCGVVAPPCALQPSWVSGRPAVGSHSKGSAVAPLATADRSPSARRPAPCKRCRRGCGTRQRRRWRPAAPPAAPRPALCSSRPSPPLLRTGARRRGG